MVVEVRCIQRREKQEERKFKNNRRGIEPNHSIYLRNKQKHLHPLYRNDELIMPCLNDRLLGRDIMITTQFGQ
jgi:hypothetical protein